MKYITILTSVILIGCAGNKVTVTDTSIAPDPADIAKCSISVGDEMVDKDYCLQYRSNSCRIQAGNCLIVVGEWFEASKQSRNIWIP